MHQRIFESIVPGALETYDLPQLAAACAPAPLTIVDPAGPTGERSAPLEAEAAYQEAEKAYERAGAGAAFRLVHAAP